MIVLRGMCRDEDDEILEAPYSVHRCVNSNTYYDYMTADQIFDGNIWPEEYERWWVELEEAPGYFMNDFGEVYSRHSNKYLKPKRLDRQGHLGFAFYTLNGIIYLYQHRLMAKYFIDNPNNYPIVRHLDDDRTANYLENLAWGTMKDNSADCKRNGHAYYLTDEDREKVFVKTRRPVRVTDLKNGRQLEYRSINDAVRDLGVRQANVIKVLTGKRKHTCGYFFEYIR